MITLNHVKWCNMDNFITDIKKPAPDANLKTGFSIASHNNHFKVEDSYHFQPPPNKEVIDYVSIHT